MLLISGSADRTLRIYDILSGECICALVGHSESVLGCTIANYDDPIIVSCSDDLSLIQWDLKTVLEDFYYTADGDENLGSRNANPPHLPVIDYVAPAELDKTQLSKEERKRIRKEQKKEKRLKNSEKYGGSKAVAVAEVVKQESNDNEDDDYYEGYDGFEKDETRAADSTSGASGGKFAPPAGTSKVIPVTDVGVVSARKASVGVIKGIMQVFGVNNTVGIEPASLESPRPSNAAAAGMDPLDAAHLRILANEATNKFKIAEVEKEIQSEKLKNEASSKLKLRLNLKKGKGPEPGAAGKRSQQLLLLTS
jgi:hypothetical protein